MREQAVIVAGLGGAHFGDSPKWAPTGFIKLTDSNGNKSSSYCSLFGYTFSKKTLVEKLSILR